MSDTRSQSNDGNSKTKEFKASLEEETKKTFKKVAETLYDNIELQEELYQRLLKVSNALKIKSTTLEDLALSELDLISINGLIGKEEHIKKEEHYIQYIVPVIIFVYIFLIGGVILFGGNSWEKTIEIPFIGVPLSVVLWAAIGSLAAILYRFYTQKPERMSLELKWLIARPIIGIIMGALGYLAVLSGLTVFGTSFDTSSIETMPRPQMLWLIAFLGGFSDKFFESLIHNVMGKLNSQQRGKKNKSETR
jgi:hypothetical protein